MGETAPSPLPWKITRSSTGSGVAIAVTDANNRDVYVRGIGFSSAREANANTDLIVCAVNAHEEMLVALKVVNKLVSEAAMTGFNHADGDWAERLFLSQQGTSQAIKLAEGC